MLIVVVWWLWMQLLGLAALPLAFGFFRRLPDRGYALARPLGLLLASYVLWLGASLGWLRNSVGGALVSIVIVAAVSFAVYRRGRCSTASTLADSPRATEDPGLLAWLRANGRLVLAVELLFAGALGLWSLLRAYSPDLTTAGGEKFMEIMYLNSIGRSDFFPPHDAWLSGYGISYYYFGYIMIALLTRLSGYPAHMVFNVGLALLFALTCTGAFSVVYNLVRRTEEQAAGPQARQAVGRQRKPVRPIAWGLLAAVLVAVLGNQEGALEVAYSARALPEGFWQWLDIEEISEPFDTAGTASLMPVRGGWWWWRASRVIQDRDPLGNAMGIQPIDEFPGFSFLLGDMHPHVLALPFVLLALALALNALLQGAERAEGPAHWWQPVRRLPLLVPLCLGALAFLNTWDFPIYWLVFLAAYALGRWDHYRGLQVGGHLARLLTRDVAVTGGAVAILGLLFYLPFYIGFQSQAGGLLPTLYVGTRFRQYFVMFGPFLVALAGLLTTLAVQFKQTRPGSRLLRNWVGWTAAFLLLPLGLMALIVLVLLLTPQGRELLDGIRHTPAVYEIVGDEPWLPLIGRLLLVKLRTWVMPLVTAVMAALGTALIQSSGPPQIDHSEHRLRSPSLHFALLCAVTGLLLALSVEFFYLVDNFRVRMNTIFKFYFQAWVLMALASAFAVYWLNRSRGRWRLVFLVGFWFLFGLGMVYPVLGNLTRAGNFQGTPTLDGTAYLKTSQAGDYAAITWLNKEVRGAPVILEAPGSGGSSYVYEGRVSALTGLPTLLGWAGHEGQWRGSYEVQQAREPDIDLIYNTLDPQAALALLGQHDVQYVYVGPLERNKYDRRGLEKFDRLLEMVYQEGGVTIYRVGKQGSVDSQQ